MIGHWWLVWLLVVHPQPAQDPVPSVWQGLEIVDIEGRSYTRAQLEGRVVLLDFWATWCAPCLAEIPTLEEVTRRFDEQDVLLLGISFDQTGRANLRSFLARNEITWPQVHDGRAAEGDLARRFRVEAVPRSVLVDPDGNVVAVDLRGEVLLAALDGLVASRRK